MAIADWSVRRIRRLWLVAGVLQLGLAGVWAVQYYRAIHRPPRALADSGFVPLSQLDPAKRDSALATLRDSFGIVLNVSGDSLRSIELTPAGQQRANAIGESVSRALGPFAWKLWALVIFAYLLFFSPTIVAGVLTLVWWRTRRQRARMLVPVAADA